LEKIGIIHLYTLGFRGDDLLSFKLGLNNPSKIAELQELEHWKQKFEAAGAATEGFFSKRWIAENMLGISEDEFLRNQREMFFDKKFAASLEAAAQGAPAGGEAGGGGLGDLGDLGGDDKAGDTGLGDLGGDTPPAGDAPAAGETPPAGGGEETTLLAEPPAKRDAPKRGPYDVKKTTKSGGLAKRIKSEAGTSKDAIGVTNRRVNMGKVGYGGMDSLSRVSRRVSYTNGFSGTKIY
jgi:hypothetical protein